MTFLQNAWYAAAYSDEVAGSPLARTVLDSKLVLFRDDQGEVGVILDRCPHRFSPLSAGKIVDGALECPYHGLRFDRQGQCIYNPHSKTKAGLRAADIRAWPVLERYGIIWIWPGDADKADPGSLPRVEFLEQPEQFCVVKGLLHVRGHYELAVDNLLDLSHAAFIHPQFSGGRYTAEELLAATKQKLERCDGYLVNHRVRSGLAPPPANCDLFGMDPDKPCHTDSTMTWYPPAFLLLATGSWEMDQPRESGVHIPQLHVITPETQFTSHYFFVNGRNRRHGEKAVDDALLAFFDLAFGQQDEPMIELVQRNMGSVSDIFELGPILLATDAAPVSARRMLAELIAKEQADAKGDAEAVATESQA